MRGFIEFIREKGVVGLAVGFILGGSVSKLVTSLVSDVVNPLIGLLLGFTKGLQSASFKVGSATILWGHFISTLIDFVIVAFVVYFGVKIFRLDKLEKNKDK